MVTAQAGLDHEQARRESGPGLRQLCLACLREGNPDRKPGLAADTLRDWRAGRIPLENDAQLPASCRPGIDARPGFPPGLQFVDPTRLDKRGLGGNRKRIAFLHAIAHIEWNAIGLALDAVWRFDGLPRQFYDDWTGVAAEEASHFQLLRGRLRELGSDYGQLPVHDGLWEAARSTAGDPLERMALVPRVFEARGLDVTPGMIASLKKCGDDRTASMLETILADEVEHVRIGSNWFHHLCSARGLEPAATFEHILRRRFRGQPRPAGGEEALQLRRRAGFRQDELDVLERLGRCD